MKKYIVFIAVVAFMTTYVANVYAIDHKAKPKSGQTASHSSKSLVTQAKATTSNGAANTEKTMTPVKESKKGCADKTGAKCEKKHSCCSSNSNSDGSAKGDKVKK
jgi:hypothetical protein